ncbi:hypothetical protein ACFZA2_04600 [Microbacterium sp. NPDC007973]|uniref:hypothetical protein n=1 Tax=Microbacterium sp. NPDC007973 TaxID=3364182 RepID=UPI0036E4166C
MTTIFVLGSGQEDNIGDVVLRRTMFDQLRTRGTLHVFLGPATPEFVTALALSDDDVVYHEKAAWRSALWRSIRRGRGTWFVDKPGELILGRRYLLAQLRMVPASLAIRLQRGRVLRLGLGQRSPEPRLTPVYRALFRLSNIVAWRDADTYATFRLGEVMPDWGFAERGSTESEGRDLLVLSYRSDKPVLTPALVSAVREAARSRGLGIAVVTQVGRDSPRSQELAAALDAELVDWSDGRTHGEQERLLRDVYRRSALVLSDRLHVLIVAMTEGAVPLALSMGPNYKVGRHFEAIGYSGVSVPVADADAASVDAVVAAALERRPEAERLLAAAVRRIDDVAQGAMGAPLGVVDGR